MTRARRFAGRVVRSVAGRSGGAVYVEFLIAFLPLLVLFECLLQLAALEVARLATQHAATCGARAAAVVLPDDPGQYSGVPVGQATGARREAIERAARLPLEVVGGVVETRVDIRGPDGAEPLEFGPQDDVTVRVRARYRCAFPLAARIVCAPSSGCAQLVAEATLPLQGARYVYD
jgi:hypothetical protein